MPPDLLERGDAAPLIGAVVRRRWWRHFALAILVIAVLVCAIGVMTRFGGLTDLAWPARIGLALLGAVASVVWANRFRSRQAAASAIERARPSCRNLVITAEELERHPGRAADAVRRRIETEASHAVGGLRPGTVVPGRTTALALVGAVAVTILSVPAARDSIRRVVPQLSTPGSPSGGSRDVRVTVTPPGYTGRAAAALTNPQRIEALEGSRIDFELPQGWRVRFGDVSVAAAVLAEESGYFAVETAESGGERLLIPLDVVPDRAPSVRIGSPAKDLLLPEGTRTIPVAISATDDLELRMLELRYTKISGSGEQFEFLEGTLPVALQRRSPREWTADAKLALGSLRLDPGDSLVYRAVAADRRPGSAGFASSDTYFIEIAGPGLVALEGVEMPPELERYAMSQQMIVLKLERLRKREAGMSRADLVEEAASIAAEQRTVRANFVFLLGGHVEDEEEEAAQSHEIQEGRLENTARKDINAAISQMTRAEQAITAVDTAAALPPARAAVESLQRAFGRRRYLLRALASRSRLDPSRRMTGETGDAGDWRRSLTEPELREGARIRELLGALVDEVPASTPNMAIDRTQLPRLAEAALAIDPSSPVWQEVSRALLDARDTAALQQVIGRVSVEALRGTIARTPLARELAPLERSHAAERRQ